MAKYKVSFIGSGNVATNLAHAFDQAGHTINQVISKNKENARLLARKYGAYYTDDITSMYLDTDFIIISVADKQYEHVIKQLPVGLKAIVCHTGGAVSLDVLSNHVSDFGVLYPLQSFRKEKILEVIEVPFFIEYSDARVKHKIEDLADSISNKVIEASSSEREKYHLAAVFANNFTNLLYDISDRYLAENGLKFEYLLPIINETAERVKYDKPINWQTGPAKRGDKSVIEKHLSQIDNKEIKNIYQIFSDFIMTKQ